MKFKRITQLHTTKQQLTTLNKHAITLSKNQRFAQLKNFNNKSFNTLKSEQNQSELEMVWIYSPLEIFCLIGRELERIDF